LPDDEPTFTERLTAATPKEVRELARDIPHKAHVDRAPSTPEPTEPTPADPPEPGKGDGGTSSEGLVGSTNLQTEQSPQKVREAAKELREGR
jgi:hypothetical protein